jgi:hypothetical protein
MERKVLFQFRTVVFLSGFLSALFMTVPGQAVQTGLDAVSGTATAAKQTEKVQLPAGAGSDWWSTVQRNLRDSEYNVTMGEKTAIPGSKASWQAPNRAHNFRTRFTGNGVVVAPRDSGDTPPWTWRATVTGYGYRENLKPAVEAELTVTGNRVEYRRGQVTEWYMNDARGLEQGFTLHGPPSGSHSSAIDLSIEIGGDMRGELNASSGAVGFFTAGGVRVLEFGKLHAVDSN